MKKLLAIGFLLVCALMYVANNAQSNADAATRRAPVTQRAPDPKSVGCKFFGPVCGLYETAEEVLK